MEETTIQKQIDEINMKLDLLLDEVEVRRQNREAVNDLINDISVISKDAFKQVVTQLDDAGIELDGDALRCLILRLIRNINNIGMVLGTLESFTDLVKDLTPVIKQVGLDGIKKFHDLEQRGYFEILNQLALTANKIVGRYSLEEIKSLSYQLINITDTLMNIMDPRLLNIINKATNAIKEIKPDDIEEYSVFLALRQLNKPEIKKSIGFIMAFINNINKTNRETIDLNN